MANLSEPISRLRESLSFYSDENLSGLTDAEIIDFANERLSDLEFLNSLYQIAMENNLTLAEFDRWYKLAADRFAEMKEGEEINEEELISLLKQVRS